MFTVGIISGVLFLIILYYANGLLSISANSHPHRSLCLLNDARRGLRVQLQRREIFRGIQCGAGRQHRSPLRPPQSQCVRHDQPPVPQVKSPRESHAQRREHSDSRGNHLPHREIRSAGIVFRGRWIRCGPRFSRIMREAVFPPCIELKNNQIPA